MTNEHHPDEPKKVKDSKAVAGMLRELHRAGEGSDEKFVKRVMTGIQRDGEIQPLEPRWTWLGGKGFWLATAAMLVLCLSVLGLHSFRILNQHAAPQEVVLYSQKDLTPG